MQVPGDGTTGHSASELQEIVGSSTQRPQEAETGGLVGLGVESTGRGVGLGDGAFVGAGGGGGEPVSPHW
jgi:hypothetical protein